MSSVSVTKPNQSRFAERILVVSTTWLEQQSEVDRSSFGVSIEGGRDTVTIRLDFSLYPRAPKAAHHSTQSRPLLTMDWPQVTFQPRDFSMETAVNAWALTTCGTTFTQRLN
jgi:hypothetical protein